MSASLKVNLIVVGKIKEAYFRSAIAEYEKRLKSYADFNIIEVTDSPAPEKLSSAEEKKILLEEGERILQKLQKGKTYALAIKGNMYSSVELAEKIERDMAGGTSVINFIIGGSLGLSDEVYTCCDEKISFSKLTFPHQLMRVILTEQIYRSMRIINHHPYHK